mgnify:CR=1 FL=1
MANCGTKRSSKKKYKSGGEIVAVNAMSKLTHGIKDLETAAVNAMSKLTRMKHYKSKKIK